LSTTGITSSLFSEIASSPSTANQFVTDLNQLAQDLQGGNLGAAQEDYVTLSDDALNGATSLTATTSASGITASLLSQIAASSSSSGTFVNELDQLGSDLQSGNLTAAQDDLADLDSTALNVASASTGTGSGTTSSAPQTSLAQTEKLIQAIIQGMESGDDSAISSAMSELASVSQSSAGASVLEQQSQSYASGAGGSSSASSTSQLLQSLDAGGDNNSTSALNLLA
jgi:hypothetical protein